MPDTTEQIAPITPAAPVVDTENIQDKMLEWTSAQIYLKRLINDWKEEIDLTEKRRKERKVEVDIESARQKGELDEDETMIPIRVIDMNITREQPAYVNYIKNSRRIGIFECVDDPNADNDLLEQEFTKKATYTAWEIPHFKCVDGSQTHGWDAVEIVYDTDKPGNFSIEQIGHDKLLFPRSSLDIQACPRVIRAYDVTITQLIPWIEKFGFAKEQVDQIMASRKDNQKEAETIRIYKSFFKYNSVVMVSWFCITNGVTDWLKKPQKHYIGIDKQDKMTGQWVPDDLLQYPIVLLQYHMTEEQRIMDSRGRCFFDGFKQEALTALWSSYINGMNRASNIYASPSAEDGTGSGIKEVEGLKLTPGRFYNKPVNFWSPPYPEGDVLRTLQFADTQNSEENNQPNFSAMNRQDSRKTAKEIGAAQEQQQLLNSVTLTLFSTYIRQVYSIGWKIVQSQALQNKIQFLLVEQQTPMMNPINPQIPVLDPQTQQPRMQTSFVNNIAVISKRYNVRAAGDVDVIAKNELITKMRQDWPVISMTPLKDMFLTDYIRLSYPERADQYAAILQQSGMIEQMKSLIARLATTVGGLAKDAPEAVAGLSQQEKSDFTGMMQEAQQVSGQQVAEPPAQTQQQPQQQAA